MRYIVILFLSAFTTLPAWAAPPDTVSSELAARWSAIEQATGWTLAALSLEPESHDPVALFPVSLTAPTTISWT